MRAVYALLLSGFLAGTAMPALAADAAWQACSGSNDQVAIRGCTEVIGRGSAETPKNLASAYFNRAVSYQNTGDYARALVDSEQALRLRPAYAQALGARANARAALGQFDQAIADFNQALTIDPGNVNYLRNRGIALGRRGNLGGALADFDEAIRGDRRNGLLFYNCLLYTSPSPRD